MRKMRNERIKMTMKKRAHTHSHINFVQCSSGNHTCQHRTHVSAAAAEYYLSSLPQSFYRWEWQHSTATDDLSHTQNGISHICDLPYTRTSRNKLCYISASCCCLSEHFCGALSKKTFHTNGRVWHQRKPSERASMWTSAKATVGNGATVECRAMNDM